MKPESEAAWAAFITQIHHRLDIGEHEYGDHSFSKQLDVLLQEIHDEICDIVGWSFVLSTRIQRIRDALVLAES